MIDMTALYRISYGLYVLTTNDGSRDNGMICNTVMQVSDKPNRIAVSINKANYSHDVVKQTGKVNVNCLSVDARFSVFENFGFRSGREHDKFEGIETLRTQNGLRILPQCCNAVLSLAVEQYLDCGSHGLFLCSITEARVLNDKEAMTYSYYHANVKPRPQKSKGYVCTICGYVYEGENLPEDYICPLCMHGADVFEPL